MKVKIQFLSCTGHIPSAQEPQVASGYCLSTELEHFHHLESHRAARIYNLVWISSISSLGDSNSLSVEVLTVSTTLPFKSIFPTETRVNF